MNEFKNEFDDIKESLKKFAENEKMFGNDVFFSNSVKKRNQENPQQIVCENVNKSKELEKISIQTDKCTKCQLSLHRTNVVAGEGNPDADLMFIGEAPGRDEDMQGKPFVGRAGKLLTRIINAMRLERNQVFIANIIKCRPPNNRNPFPDEIKACSSYLERQLQIINPKIICTLGKFSSQTLLNTEESISRLRGSFHEYKGIKVMPTYHPAYLLRNPSGKKLVWDDMQKIMEELNL